MNEVTMVSPPPGFANRVMERVRVHKRAREMRRAAISLGLVFIASAALLGVATLRLVLDLSDLASLPSEIVPLFIAAASFAEPVFTVLDVLWSSATAVASSINSLILTGYAIAAIVLTTLWVQIAFGPFQYPLNLSWRIER
jgi:Na+/proline symporter